MDRRQRIQVAEEDDVARLEGGDADRLAGGPHLGRGRRDGGRGDLLVELRHIARAVGALPVGAALAEGRAAPTLGGGHPVVGRPGLPVGTQGRGQQQRGGLHAGDGGQRGRWVELRLESRRRIDRDHRGRRPVGQPGGGHHGLVALGRDHPGLRLGAGRAAAGGEGQGQQAQQGGREDRRGALHGGFRGWRDGIRPAPSGGVAGSWRSAAGPADGSGGTRASGNRWPGCAPRSVPRTRRPASGRSRRGP